MCKNRRHIGGIAFPRSKQADIGILLRSYFIIVSGADMRISTQDFPLPPNHQQKFGVRLTPSRSIYHLAAGMEQPFDHLQIVRLIKPRLQFHQNHYRLAAFRSTAKRIDHR